MQAISQRLFDAIGDDTIVPGISGRNARLLWKASRSTFGDIEDEGVRGMALAFQKKYGEEIGRFDNALIERIMRNPRLAGKIEPEHVVEAVFKKGNVGTIHRLKNAVHPATWEKVKRGAMEDMTDQLVKRTDDPVISVMAGKEFLNTLDSYGKPTLEAMFGRDHADALYRLGRVAQTTNVKMAGAGGLVAANLALHPLRNFGKLAQIFTMQKFLATPFAIRWYTEGLKAPNTRAGAAALTRAAVFMLTTAQSVSQTPTQTGQPQRPSTTTGLPAQAAPLQ